MYLGIQRRRAKHISLFFTFLSDLTGILCTQTKKSVYKGPKRGLPDFVGRVEVMGWGNGTSTRYGFEVPERNSVVARCSAPPFFSFKLRVSESDLKRFIMLTCKSRASELRRCFRVPCFQTPAACSWSRLPMARCLVWAVAHSRTRKPTRALPGLRAPRGQSPWSVAEAQVTPPRR